MVLPVERKKKGEQVAARGPSSLHKRRDERWPGVGGERHMGGVVLLNRTRVDIVCAAATSLSRRDKPMKRRVVCWFVEREGGLISSSWRVYTGGVLCAVPSEDN